MHLRFEENNLHNLDGILVNARSTSYKKVNKIYCFAKENLRLEINLTINYI